MRCRFSPQVAVLAGVAAGLGSESGLAGPAGEAITFDAVYTGEPIRNLDGGLRTGGTYLDNLDLQVVADRGSIFGVPGLSGMLYVLNNNSSEFSAEYVGDSHVVSNIDAPRGLRLYEAWLDWAPGSGNTSTRVGLYDLNSEFDAIETGGLFLNSAHGIGPDFSQSGLNGPSIFPVTSLALRVRVGFEPGGYGQFAVLDGVPGDPDDPESNEIDLSGDDGALVVAEFGWSANDWRKLAIGAWAYTADFDRLASTGGPQDDGNNGWYAFADRTVWQGTSAVVAAYLRAGRADDRFNPFDTYVGLGTSLTGFVASRPEDEVGVAVATTFTGNDYERARRQEDLDTDDYETSIELTYRAPITNWLTLQPDIQYVINPGVDPALDNALVISLRFELSYSKQLTAD